MQFDFNCLLTKSYTYNGSFDQLIFKICSSIKKLKSKDNFFADSLPIHIFYKNQTADKVACYLNLEKTNEILKKKKIDFNFLVIPLSSNIFRHHLIEQAKEAVEIYKNKINETKKSRNDSIENLKGNAILKKILLDVNDYCEKILGYKKYSASEERSDGILKNINRVANYLNSNFNDKYNSILLPFIVTIKNLRKYLSFLKMTSFPKCFDNVAGFAVTIGKNSVLNISLFPIYKIDKKNCDFYSRQYWSSRAYRDSNDLNGMLDNFSLMFDHINLGRIFGIDGNEDQIVQNNDSEIKRATFGKMSFEKPFFKHYWLQPFEEFQNDFLNIKTYFSLMSTNLFLYRDISFTTQKQWIDRQLQKGDLFFSLPSMPPYFTNNNISDFDNFFCHSNRSVFLTSSYAYFETSELNTFDSEKHDYDDWFINKIVNNHRHRFASDIDASIIVTSIIYSSMFGISQFNIRAMIESINNSTHHLPRLFKSHRFVTHYEKTICVYSSHGPFIKDDTNRISTVVFEANRLKEQENDTELFVKNLWQESNLTNGKIFPFIQAFAAIITVVSLIFAIDIELRTGTLFFLALLVDRHYLCLF